MHLRPSASLNAKSILNARSFAFAIMGSILFSTLSAAIPANAQEAKKEKDQTFEGTLSVPGAKLRMQLKLTRNNNKRLRATLFSVDQNNAEIKIDSVSIRDEKITFSAKALRIEYAGTFSEDGKNITGTFKQGGAPFKLDFAKIANVKPNRHIESWQGVLKAGTQEFDFQVRVYESESGELSGKLDSFSENLFGLNLIYSVKDNDVHFELPLTKAKYSGTYGPKKETITGTWEQRGNQLDLNFKKIALEKTRDASSARPQTPKPPFPYNVKEVSYENKKDGVSLAGTLTTPKGEGPFPAVVLITGSGQQDRNSTIMGHKSFWVIADALTRKGIAVLRYDERGIGKSTGDFSKVNSLDLARDVECGLDFLRKQPNIDAEKLGLIGHSEGGYIAPMIAARNKRVAYIVMLAGPGVPGRQIVLNQSRLIMNSTGANKEMVDLSINFSKALFDQMEKSAGQGDMVKQLQKRFDQFTNGLPNDKKKELGDLDQQRAGMHRMATPWFQFFAMHDPRQDLRKVKCPVLVLNGTVDLQVDADLNLPEIEKALKQAGNGDVTIHRLEKLNHLFQKSETGRIDEYPKLTETFNKDALKLVVDWVVSKTK